MHVDEFNYRLPKELIAQRPLPERDASRLMVLRRETGTIEHHMFRDLPGMLRLGDRIVVNDTRVIPARLFGYREGGTGRVEVLLHRPVDSQDGRPTYQALARPAKKILAGTRLFLGSEHVAVDVVEELDTRGRVVAFPKGFKMSPFLEAEGHIPLPPYITRGDDDEDQDRYQTVFANVPGAVAAPTAGLHFSPEILAALAAGGVGRSAVTLRVGLGTFSPVTVETVEEHVMDHEHYRIGREAAEAITSTRRLGGRIIAVGTTVVRTLETAAHHIEPLNVWGVRETEGETNLFITPPYDFRIVDALITNFHLPRSTLLMLVAAFGGQDLMHEAYREAVSHRYRVYSYGDAMLIL